MRIDLNSDVGESFGVYTIGNDAGVLDFVTSANIACGWHAGDPKIMRETVQLAIEQGVAIGAHPGLPDLGGFGRRNMAVSAAEAYDFVLYQVGALNAFVQAAGGRLRHVKPHGALYNMAAKDAGLADAIARAIYDFNRQLILVGLAGSELTRAGRSAGLQTAGEAFADRTYQSDGSLTNRRSTSAVIQDTEQVVQQALRIVRDGKVLSQQGTEVRIEAATICIHGDSPNAVTFAHALRKGLQDAEVEVGPL